jgi:hypothetical protein
MKGLAAAALVAALLTCLGLAVANPPLKEPLQYEQFCENQKVSGSGVVDVSTSVVDKKIALQYSNTMAGDGDIELDQTHAYSQKADKLQENVSMVNNGSPSALNLFEKTKLTYNAKNAPLTGEKYLNSKAFYGGIGADVHEVFSVNQMEKDQTTFFASTASNNPSKPCNPPIPYCPPTPCCPPNPSDSSISYYPLNYCPTMPSDSSLQYYPPSGYTQPSTTPETTTSETVNNPVHLIGMDTKNSFNGTWGVDANWHKIFYKDIKLHELFTGTFETEKQIKFHENPVASNEEENPCAGIDC